MVAFLTSAIVYLFVEVALALGAQKTVVRTLRDPFAPDVGIRRPSRTIERREFDQISKAKHRTDSNEEVFSSSNGWGFHEAETEWPSQQQDRGSLEKSTTKVQTTTPYYEEVDPNRNGLLKDIGSINVGFGVGVGVPGNDPVRVGTRVGVGFGESGLAGQLPIGQDIYPRQKPFGRLEGEMSPRVRMERRYRSFQSNDSKSFEGKTLEVLGKKGRSVLIGQFQSLNDYDGDKSNIVPDRARKYWQAVREGRIKIPHYRPAPSLVGVGGNIGVG